MLAALPVEYPLEDAIASMLEMVNIAAGIGLTVMVAMLAPGVIARGFRKLIAPDEKPATFEVSPQTSLMEGFRAEVNNVRDTLSELDKDAWEYGSNPGGNLNDENLWAGVGEVSARWGVGLDDLAQYDLEAAKAEQERIKAEAEEKLAKKAKEKAERAASRAKWSGVFRE